MLRWFLLALVIAPIGPAASAQWQQPSPEELSMTADPAAPGQAAVYLNREETVDDTLHLHTLYARIKILSDHGKDMADVEMPVYEGSDVSITNVAGRTIHSDGSIIPFTGKPFDKIIEKTRNYKYQTKAFTLPDVQVGSILESRYVLRYADYESMAPRWYIQQSVFVHKAHYHFVPSPTILNSGFGMGSRLAYSKILPADAELKQNQARGTYDLDLQNIPALPNDEYMPPMDSISYRLLFYYTDFQSADDFWKTIGKSWSKNVDRFAEPSKKLHAAVDQIGSPADTPQQKLQKIYAAVMEIDNTSFTRIHSERENKSEGVKIRTAGDIWQQKRGNDDEIAMLFIAMVRAAGMKAYAMRVADRDRWLFQTGYPSMSQLNEILAIVPYDGADHYFDPGQRYCEFGKLHWIHTMAKGLRQTEDGTAITTTPNPNYRETKLTRSAELTVSPGGEVQGIVRINYTGDQALEWRHRILRTDEAEAARQFEDALKAEIPQGLHVKTSHFIGLKDYGSPFTVVADVSGQMGTVTARRMFLPSSFFESSTKPIFVAEKRQSPVDLGYPYCVEDHVALTLPPGITVESLPQPDKYSFAPNAAFGSGYHAQDGKIFTSRAFVIGNSLYPSKEYPQLREFYQKVNSKDQEQVILKITPATGMGQ